MENPEIKNLFKLFVDEEGILNLVFLPEPGTLQFKEDERAQLVMEAAEEIFRRNPERHYAVLVDNTLLKKFSFPAAARKTYARLSANPQIKKAAVLYGNQFYRVAVGLVLRAAGQNFRAFDDKNEALEWLKGD